MYRRTFCSITLAALVFAAFSRSISFAAVNSQSPVDQASGELDDQFVPLLKNLGGDAANSIGIDYTPEARCSDNNCPPCFRSPAILSFPLAAWVTVR
jgi:hypothetical protein